MLLLTAARKKGKGSSGQICAQDPFLGSKKLELMGRPKKRGKDVAEMKDDTPPLRSHLEKRRRKARDSTCRLAKSRGRSALEWPGVKKPVNQKPKGLSLRCCGAVGRMGSV